MSDEPPTGQSNPEALAPPDQQLRLSRRSAVIVVIYSLTILLVNLGQSRVLTLHEVQYCQPAREMIESGNWLVPTVAGVPFLWRLPATSWMIAVTMELTGSQSETVVRLPGVISGVLLALLVAALTARWFGNRAGLFAGLMQGTTVATLQLARLAEGEIHLGLSVAAALGAFACANVDSPSGRMQGRWLSVAFYLATGWSFLIKALIGPAFIISACGAYLLVSRDRRVLKFLFDPVGLLVLALCVIPWTIAAYRVCPEYLELQIANHFGRFKGELGRQGAPWFYLGAVPLKVLPWTPLVTMGCVKLIRQGKWRNPIWLFGLCWLTPGLILLSTSRFKSAHYPAPLLPPLLMAAAVQLMTYLQTRRWLDRPVAVGFGALWLIVAGVWFVVMPSQDSYRGNWELAHRANDQIPADQPVYLVELTEDQIVYYLHSHVVWLLSRDQLLERLSQSSAPEVYVLTPEYVAEALTRQDQGKVLDRCETLRRSMKPRDRITLVKLPRPNAPVASSAPAPLR